MTILTCIIQIHGYPSGKHFGGRRDLHSVRLKRQSGPTSTYAHAQIEQARTAAARVCPIVQALGLVILNRLTLQSQRRAKPWKERCTVWVIFGQHKGLGMAVLLCLCRLHGWTARGYGPLGLLSMTGTIR